MGVFWVYGRACHRWYPNAMEAVGPKQVGSYEIRQEIGRGGMGVVYLARDTRLDRDVAIKVLPEQFARDLRRLERLQREAKVLASINHPHIAAIYQLEVCDSQPYLVMEHVEGTTLAQRLEDGPMPAGEA